MALGFFATLFLAIFSLIFFLGGADRLSPGTERSLAAAESLLICQRAGVVEAQGNAGLGNGGGGVEFDCSDAAMTNPVANGVLVTGARIRINPGTDVGVASGRIVVAFVPNNTPLNGVPFDSVRAQFGIRFNGESNAGQVQVIGGNNVINNVGGVEVRVPATVPAGALALVTTIQP